MSRAQEVGQKLVDYVRRGRNLDAIDDLYAKNVVSIEATDPPQGEREISGVKGVREKNEWWAENHTVHSADVKGPFPHGSDRFCVVYSYDVTNKPSGQRWKMEEVAHYTVSQGGKIAREEFFYSM